MSNTAHIFFDSSKVHLAQTERPKVLFHNVRSIEKAVAALKENEKISILDARLPSGFWSIFNPLIAFIYKHWASWDYTKNIAEDLTKLVRNAQTQYFNGGSIYITRGTKQ